MSLSLNRLVSGLTPAPQPTPSAAPSMTVRKLWPTETDAFRDHLLRLDPDSRRMRFAHAVSDDFIANYAEHMCDMGSIVYGCIDQQGCIRAAAELRKLGTDWGEDAEAAFSVEAPVQDSGLGTLLMGKVIRSARNRGINHLYMSCLAENAAMQKIAKKHDALLRFEYGEVMGDIVPGHFDFFSQIAEAVDDRVGFLMAVVDLNHSTSRNSADDLKR